MDRRTLERQGLFLWTCIAISIGMWLKELAIKVKDTKLKNNSEIK